MNWNGCITDPIIMLIYGEEVNYSLLSYHVFLADDVLLCSK